MSKFDTKRNGRVVRAPKDRENPYVMMNKEFLSVNTLSWKAKGVLAYLLSKTDTWIVIIEDIIKQSTDGEKAVRSGINELIAHNYVQRYPAYYEGKVYCWESMVAERPFPNSEKIKFARIIELDEEGCPFNLEYIYISEEELEEKKGEKKEKKTAPKDSPNAPKNAPNDAPNSSENANENLGDLEPQGVELLSQNLQVGNLQVENAGLLIKDSNNKRDLINKDINNIDDDKRRNDSPLVHNEDDIESIINNLRESYKPNLSGRSFDAVVRKVMDKYNQGKVSSFRDYLSSALTNKLEELELRRAKDKAKIELLAMANNKSQQQPVQESYTAPKPPTVQFYNWLEERE